MPLPVFLQHLDARQVDVALLLDPERNVFRSGIGGIDETLEASLDGLRSLLRMDDYRSVVSLGTSGGGMPAVLAAFRLGMDGALFAGGNGPDDPRWEDFAGIGVRELITRYRAVLDQEPKVFLVFGADSSKDTRSAKALAEVIPAHLIPVGDSTEPVGHNAFYHLVEHGQFTNFLDRTLFSAHQADDPPLSNH